MYFIDPEGDGDVEVRRIVDVEWQTAKAGRGNNSKYTVVTQIIKIGGEDTTGTNDILIPYEINNVLHNMIAAALDEYNINYVMLNKPEDMDGNN